MNMQRQTTDPGNRPVPPAVIQEQGSRRLARTTQEIVFDLERSRRFSTLEVEWDMGIDRLTIEDIQIDACLDVAARIMEVLPYDQFELESVDGETVRYRILATGLALKTAVFLKRSLRRLASDPARAVKIEYLRRDLLWSTRSRSSFVYPNALRKEIE